MTNATTTSATYTINAEHNGIEIAFNRKPSADALNAIKTAGFRWLRARRIWYARNTAARLALAQALTGETTPAETPTADRPAPQNRIKIYYNGFRLDGSKELVKVRYHYDNDSGAVTMYADGYGADLPRDLFDVKNDTDIMTDYFDKDRATVDPSHPLYKYIRYAALKARARQNKRSLEYTRGRAAYAGTVERMTAELKAFDAEKDPGQPTAADLEKINTTRQAAENARREAEHAAQIAERERVIAERVDGRKYIEGIAAAYPIEEGAPVVEIKWSENPAFYSWGEGTEKTRTVLTVKPDGTTEKEMIIEEPARRLLLSVSAADIILARFDNKVRAERRGYDKTGFVISYTAEDGELWTYAGRYDLGDGDGGLIGHIEQIAKWESQHDNFGHDKEYEKSPRFEWVDLLKRYRATPEATATA